MLIFSGKYTAYGGTSNTESGGAGTIYIKYGNESNTERHLLADNRNQQPVNVYLSKTNDTLYDTGKTWLLPDSSDEIQLSKLAVKGRAHLAVSLKSVPSIKIKASRLEGDFTGQLHASAGVNLNVLQSNPFFPASFRVYKEGHIGLPENVTLDSFANKDVSIDGTIDGVKDLTISSGVRVLLGNKVCILVPSHNCFVMEMTLVLTLSNGILFVSMV